MNFSKAVNAELVTSVAISPGVRDASGKWTPAEAAKVFAYTKTVGGTIAATEFMNEPNAAAMGGAPKGYDARNMEKISVYSSPFLRTSRPRRFFSGQVRWVRAVRCPLPPGSGIISSADLLQASGAAFDAFRFTFTRLSPNAAPKWELRWVPPRPMPSRRNGLLDPK